MADKHVSPTKVLHQCMHCGSGFYPKRTDRLKFCSKTCSDAAAKLEGERKRADKNGPYRKVWFNTCAECTSLFVARRVHTKCCSGKCYTRNISRAAVGTKPERSCSECGCLFRSRYGDRHRKFCSDICQNRNSKRAAKAARRARMKAKFIEKVNPVMVFNRDRWTCRYCGIATPRSIMGTSRGDAPTLDHIVPLSRNGDHSYRNTQCLCRSCNNKKSDRIWAVSGWEENATTGVPQNFS